MFRYRAKQRNLWVQVYAAISLVVFAMLVMAGLTTAATIVAIASLAVYLYGRLA